MPNYAYRCCECKNVTVLNLPISTNPKKTFACECGYTMKRVIKFIPQMPENVNKVFAGDWYKKEYGHDLGEGSLNKAQQAEDRKTLEREFRRKTGQ